MYSLKSFINFISLITFSYLLSVCCFPYFDNALIGTVFIVLLSSFFCFELLTIFRQKEINIRFDNNETFLNKKGVEIRYNNITSYNFITEVGNNSKTFCILRISFKNKSNSYFLITDCLIAESLMSHFEIHGIQENVRLNESVLQYWSVFLFIFLIILLYPITSYLLSIIEKIY